MKRVVSIVAAVLVAISIVAWFWFLASTRQIDVLQPTGEVATAQHGILMFALFLSALVVVPVFTMLVYFSVRYRARNVKADYRPDWGESKILEGLWWGIPIAIIGVLGVLTYTTSHSLDPYKPLSGGEPLEVQVVALRWKWLFIYPEQQVATLNYLPLPVDRPIKFSMTADAPMSAFWIPSLGSQVYAMNGMQSQLNLKANKLGEYTGYTTNINGEGYAKMTFRTKVISQTDFGAWAIQASASPEKMNMKQYESLEQPESVTAEKTYEVTNSKLFNTIMNKYGHSHHMEGAS